MFRIQIIHDYDKKNVDEWLLFVDDLLNLHD